MPTTPSHTGRVAVVTGAAGGFGTTISLELARRGADIIAVDLKAAEATVSAVHGIGRKGIALQADLADPEQVEAITGDMLGFAGHVDILVNNAGVFPFRDIWELDFAEWKRIQAINLDSQFLMAKAVMGSMRESSWGRIVNLASNSLGLAVPNMVPYMAAKGGVVGFTRALATDLAPHGITVNAICPTASSTPGGQDFIGDEVLHAVAEMQAIKRIGTATDIVGAVCFLSSDDCAFMTGQTIVADGGLMRV
ncbi:SDR family NAD(P)-dependent oxidoreductase [Actinomadura opuntiae]|uniref:SDR family NAD(P)-dependent oxidoreductase n=1 Tax=Actinomadura sp. OS1-43 TaxID=604315 RepID=UPI00255AC3D2|nr:SDR family NAD(P)-dependent oxidoreductase [Actinomadura sp. OS1-43]MDL4821792.1 SDR family NAD(P)-dependent oxidoreductase [Actinomadura sp. OS1-43]